jgi:hypothetical protein
LVYPYPVNLHLKWELEFGKVDSGKLRGDTQIEDDILRVEPSAVE